jgi:hypothetical protein
MLLIDGRTAIHGPCYQSGRLKTVTRPYHLTPDLPGWRRALVKTLILGLLFLWLASAFRKCYGGAIFAEGYTAS